MFRRPVRTCSFMAGMLLGGMLVASCAPAADWVVLRGQSDDFPGRVSLDPPPLPAPDNAPLALPVPDPAAETWTPEQVLPRSLTEPALKNDTGDTVKVVSEALASLQFTWLAGSGDDFGFFSGVFQELPKSGHSAVATAMVQPGWGIHWINGADSLKLEPRLYQFTIPLDCTTEIDDVWTVDMGITPGWFTDGVNKRPEMFRLLGHYVVTARMTSEHLLTLGFVYLDRDDIAALPVAGLIIDQPHRGRRFELVFPRPHLAWRIAEYGEAACWFTLTGELGGGSYAIKRYDRTNDVMTYRDLRLIGGLEFLKGKRLLGSVEAGWVFDRSLEFRTENGNQKPGDTALVRMTLAY